MAGILAPAPADRAGPLPQRQLPLLPRLSAGIWFTPSCSTCRSARDHLEEAGVEFTLRRYLDDPPTEAELRRALTALGLEPWDITRMSEPLARELGLTEMARDDDTLTEVLPAGRRPAEISERSAR